MSINAMTNAALARRRDFPPDDDFPRKHQDIAQAASGAAAPANKVTDFLAVIATYIPTEILALYIALLAALKTGDQPLSESTMLGLLIGFIVGTPLVVLLIYGAKLKSAKKELPKAEEWPVWEMAAATIAFCAWAVSLPEAPFLRYAGLPSGLGAVLVMVASTALGLLAPYFQKPLPDDSLTPVPGEQPPGSRPPGENIP